MVARHNFFSPDYFSHSSVAEFYVHGSVHHITICMNVQLGVTIYRFILETQQLYMFRVFLAHSQE
jgi:hypothetical protein